MKRGVPSNTSASQAKRQKSNFVNHDTIYDNVACLVLSKDSSNELWVHLGVEVRGHGKTRKPKLSSFGGTIDIINGKKEHPVDAVFREMHEESLGLLNQQVPILQLLNQE